MAENENDRNDLEGKSRLDELIVNELQRLNDDSMDKLVRGYEALARGIFWLAVCKRSFKDSPELILMVETMSNKMATLPTTADDIGPYGGN